MDLWLMLRLVAQDLARVLVVSGNCPLGGG